MLVTIHAPSWLCGTGHAKLYQDGSYCLLGFIAKAIGFRTEELDGRVSLDHALSVVPKGPRRNELEKKLAMFYNPRHNNFANDLTAKLVYLNDVIDLSHRARVQEIYRVLEGRIRIMIHGAGYRVPKQ